MKKIIDYPKIRFVKSVYYLIVTFFAVLLHSLCCVFPLVAVTVSTSFATIMTPYKPLLIFVQLLVVLFVSFRVFQNRKTIHHRKGQYLNYFILLIAIAGLIMSWLEPFKSERQAMAEHRFALFKSNRSLTIQIRDTAKLELAENVLRTMDGVRTVRIIGHKIQLTYNVEQLTPEQIGEVLKSKGYLLELK